MKSLKLVSLFSLLISISACVSNAPKPIRSNVSAVAVSVSLKAPIISFISQTPQVVYFIRLDKNKKINKGLTVIPSNFRDGDDFYLLNAKPGHYVVVGAMYSRQRQTATTSTKVGTSSTFTFSFTPNNSYGTFFNSKIVEMSTITVKPGKMSYMGDYVISMHNGMDEVDSTQRYYMNIVDPQSRMNHYRGNISSAKNTINDKMSFLREASKDMKEAGWSNYALGGIAELK